MAPKYDSKVLSDLATDPLKFVKLCWPDMQLYEKQVDILLSVRDNIETLVHAGNKTGKSRCAAIVALWFFASRSPARVIVSSSGESQLASILWSEISHLIQASRIPFPFKARHLSVRKLVRPDSQDTTPQDYLRGHVTDTVESFQGHHLANDKPRVLVIFDEASAIGDDFFEASRSWAHRILAIGNPLSNSGFFFHYCRRGDQPDPAGGEHLLSKVIHIGATDSPNVQAGLRWTEKGGEGEPPNLVPGLLSYPEYLRHQSQWDEILRTIRLDGVFYEGDQVRLIPDKWLDLAMDPRGWAELNCGSRKAEAMGVDVAAGGRDKTCWTIVDQHGVIEQIVMDLEDSMQIVGMTIQLMEKYNLFAGRVAIDAGGGGKQIADRLREKGHYVNTVGFGETAEAKPTYRNKRAELYGQLRARFQNDADGEVFHLPPDAHELRRELAVMPLKYDSEGRMVLPPKSGSSPHPGEKTICQLLGRSPDRADSLVLALWVLDRYRHISDHADHVYYDEDQNRPLTAQEYADMPDEFREIYDMGNEDIEPSLRFGRRRRRTGWIGQQSGWRIRYGRGHDDDE